MYLNSSAQNPTAKCYDFVINGKCRCRPWYRISVHSAHLPLAAGGLGIVDRSCPLCSAAVYGESYQSLWRFCAQALDLALAMALPHTDPGRMRAAAPASVQRVLLAAPLQLRWGGGAV
jgi:hypothetical protein